VRQTEPTDRKGVQSTGSSFKKLGGPGKHASLLYSDDDRQKYLRNAKKDKSDLSRKAKPAAEV